MQCQHCEHQNAPDYLFCENCGKSLKQVCPECGHHNELDFRFCMECGHPLAQEAADVPASEEMAPPEPEPKQQAQTPAKPRTDYVPASEELEAAEIAEEKAPAKEAAPGPAPGYIPASEDAAVAAPPPQIIIIREEKEKKRRTPGWLWLLIGALLVLVLLLLTPQPTMRAIAAGNDLVPDASPMEKTTSSLWLTAHNAKKQITVGLPEAVSSITSGGDSRERAGGGNNNNDDYCGEIANNIASAVFGGSPGYEQNLEILIINDAFVNGEFEVSVLNNPYFQPEWTICESDYCIIHGTHDPELLKTVSILVKDKNSTCEFVKTRSVSYVSNADPPPQPPDPPPVPPVPPPTFTPTFQQPEEKAFCPDYSEPSPTFWYENMQELTVVFEFPDDTPQNETSADWINFDIDEKGTCSWAPGSPLKLICKFDAQVTANPNDNRFIIYYGPGSEACKLYDLGRLYVPEIPTIRSDDGGTDSGSGEESSVCPFGETYHESWKYNNGCCTDGCWCKESGQWGCWATCASHCDD